MADEAWLRRHLEREAFALGAAAPGPERIGAEVELLPVVAATGRMAPILATDQPATLPVLQRVARARRWCESTSLKAGVPEFRTGSGGRITYEPGGQIEYSAPPATSLSVLLADLRGVTDALREGCADAGIHLVGRGVDAVDPIEQVPLQLHAGRYQRMDAHFARLGLDGARMMRQTASIQVCVDAGPEPLRRWRLLNALAPYLVAIFANAPVYEGRLTGHQSERRRIWGALDPARTGLPWDGTDPVGAYAEFALGAAAILSGAGGPPFPSFAARLAQGEAVAAEWAAHLTTLFPEVRPRGYFEVRSIDALDPALYAAPLVLVAGLAWSPEATRIAEAIAGDPDASLLPLAGQRALADPALAAGAVALADAALAGCESLGSGVVSAADLRAAGDFFDRYTRTGRAPAAAALERAAGTAGGDRLRPEGAGV